jgi:hypothetical protein
MIKIIFKNKYHLIFLLLTLTKKHSDQRCATLDLKPRLLVHRWLGHCFKAVALPYSLLIRNLHGIFSVNK